MPIVYGIGLYNNCFGLKCIEMSGRLMVLDTRAATQGRSRFYSKRSKAFLLNFIMADYGHGLVEFALLA